MLSLWPNAQRMRVSVVATLALVGAAPGVGAVVPDWKSLYNPISNPDATFVVGKVRHLNLLSRFVVNVPRRGDDDSILERWCPPQARFTALTSGLLRMEWDDEAKFQDAATFAMVNRYLTKPEVRRSPTPCHPWTMVSS
jgi:hypothetical protein